MYVCVLVVGILGFLGSRLNVSVFVTAASVLMLVFPGAFSSFFNLNDKEVIVPVIFFLAGMAIFTQRSTISIRARHVLCLLVLAALTEAPTFEFLVYILIGLCAIWFGCSRLLARLPRLPGDYSYGVYIYAFPVQQALASIWPAATPYQMFVVAMLAVLPCAIASWHFVELPAQRVGKRLAHSISGTNRTDGGIFPVARQSWRSVALPVTLTIIAILGTTLVPQQSSESEPTSLPAQIAAFGPTPVVHGQPFNQQSDGKSAIWVRLNHQADEDFILVLSGRPLPTVVNGDLLTAYVPADLFRNPGAAQLWVEAVRQARKVRSKSVTFLVQ